MEFATGNEAIRVRRIGRPGFGLEGWAKQFNPAAPPLRSAEGLRPSGRCGSLCFPPRRAGGVASSASRVGFDVGGALRAGIASPQSSRPSRPWPATLFPLFWTRRFRLTAPLLVVAALAVLPAASRGQTQRPVEEIANKVYNPVSLTLMGNPGSNPNTLSCTSAPNITLSTQQIFNCTYDQVNKALFITLASPLPASQGGTGQAGYGTAGQCLQSGGAGAPMTWGTCGSGGGSGLPSGGTSSQVLIGGAPSTWGSVPAAALPAPTASTLGGVESSAATAHNWISYIDTTGLAHQSQPAFTDLSGTASAAQIPNVPTQIATSGAVGDPGGSTYYEFCNYSAGCTFTAPAGVAGLQRCYRNATGVTAVMTLQMASGNTVDMNGANGSSGGYLSSGGALGDSVCVVSDAANHWYAYAGGGTWTNH